MTASSSDPPPHPVAQDPQHDVHGQADQPDDHEHREDLVGLQEPLRLGEVGIFQLINAFQTVIKRIEARQEVQEIFGERFSVSAKIDAILQRVATGTPLRFSDLFGAAVSRVEVVVTFLALLELIRLKQVRAVQKNIFEEIEIAPAAT